jgi:transposase InsO family protein
MIDKAVKLKKEQPLRSHQPINEFLRHEFQAQVPRSTLYRHLKEHGATRLKLGVSRQKVRGRWTRDHSNALWLGDFQDGPYVMHQGQVVQTHLSAFIDCHSRFILDARYYLRESLDILIDTLLRAWSLHGASNELYLDNAKIYHAHALRAACCALGIRLIHRAVRDAPPGGLIERFFRTVQTQFEAEVRAGNMLTLDYLHSAFAAWLEVSYHQHLHAETKQTPHDRYQQGLRVVRNVNIQQVLKYFFKREQRTVHPDFSDVQVHNAYFRVDEKLRRDKVEVRYDPFRLLEEVLIYSLQGEYLGVGLRHQREPDGSIPPPATTLPVPQHNYLDLLIDKHQQIIRGRQGIDYQSVLASAQQRWPFPQFAAQLAEHLGRKGGLAAFSAQELGQLQQAWQRLRGLDAEMLREACRRAQQRTILEIVLLLQQLSQERNL